MKYIFVLGRDKELAVLEVISFLQARNINYNFIMLNDDFLVLDIHSFAFTADDFGGVVKIGKEFSIDQLKFGENIVTYSFLGSEKNKDALKQYFKKEGIKGIFRKYTSKPTHFDLEVIEMNKTLFRIFSVSNPKKYKTRDENRPAFDEKKVISIRLAKILINLSQARKEILDPFCGCGTILQEGLLQGLNVLGVDKSIYDGQHNIHWVKKEFSLKNKFKIIKGDAKKLSTYFNKVEAIVTEPYLGPYWRKTPSQKEAYRAMKKLQKMYFQFLLEASKIVQGKVVVIVPIIKAFGKTVGMDFEALIQDTGFRAVVFEEAQNPVVYDLKDSWIKREIWVLEKLK